MRASVAEQDGPRTEALRKVLLQVHDKGVAADLLFLEYWQTQSKPDVATSLRASQIRRANPALAEAIHDELTRR